MGRRVNERLVAVSEAVALAAETLAVVAIAIGTLEAFVGAARTAFRKQPARWRRETWLRYARWLVAALTFQLGADIVMTSVAPSWEEIGRLGAVALIRTFLNFFLEHDLERAEREEAGA